MDITSTVNIINTINNIDPMDQLNINEILYYQEIIVNNEATKIETVEELNDEELREMKEILEYYLEQDKIQEENDAMLEAQVQYEITHCCICMCEIVPHSTVCSKECDNDLKQMRYEFPLGGNW